MADVTYYVALPFLQDEAGSPVAGAAEECQTSSGALRRAEILSKVAGSIGAVAFCKGWLCRVAKALFAPCPMLHRDIPGANCRARQRVAHLTASPRAVFAPCAHTLRYRPLPALGLLPREGRE